ncbi:Phage-related minor tail protein [Salinibacillus kushneri]|uniref:Phage-related minor tail protein n=1 Tax=Salinibacillus kushneri TaxID=237682 RepID=A0A1I0B7I0_9BACI|nr:hypothetical protein [Salinibacillus kushneri]SET02472.1 Phage-related minor tail protein [Salinibacillus kushneri]
MAKRIKGITIELEGETRGLDNALQDVNKRSRNLNSELRDVERLLKFDPGNTEALAQKQRLLASQVENTSNKLDQLKQAERQVQQQFERGDVGEEQYRSFQREIQFTEAELRKFEKRLESVDDGKALQNTEKDMKDIDEATNKAEKSAKNLGDSFKTVAKTAAGIGAAGAAGIGGLVEGMEEYNTSMARLKTNAQQANVSMDDVNGAFKQMKVVSDETDSSVEAVSNLIAAGFDPSGITEATNAISGAAIKWSDTLNVEGLSDGIQETIASGQAIGQFDEMLSRSGINVDKFNERLAQTTSAQERQQMVLETLTNSGLAGYFEEYRDGNKELVAQKEAQENLNSALGELSTNLSPLVTMVKNFVAEIVGWVNESVELVKSFDSVGEGLQALFSQLAEQGMSIITSLVDSIVQNLPMLMETGMQILQNIIQGIITAIPELLELWPQIMQMQAENLNTFLPQIIQMGIMLIQALIQGILNALPSIMQAIITLLTTLLNVIVENLPMIIDAGIQILNALIDGIVNMLPQLMDMALQLVTSLIDVLIKNLPMVIDAGIKILNALIEGVLDILPELMDTALELVMTVFNVLIENLPKIIDAGIQLLNALIDGIVSILPELVSQGVQLIIELVGALIAELPTIIEAGIKILFALIDGLLDAIPDLIGAIPKIVGAIFDAFGEVDWLDIGINIMEGLKDGILNMAGSVVDAAKGVVDNAVEGAKNLLGIASPSKVFRQIGEYTGEGLEIGIKDMEGRVASAGQRLAESSVPKNAPEFSAPESQSAVTGKNSNNTGQSINQYITINSPEPTSPAENARKMKQASRQLAMEWEW